MRRVGIWLVIAAGLGLLACTEHSSPVQHSENLASSRQEVLTEPLKQTYESNSAETGPNNGRYENWPLWSSNRLYSAGDNACHHFEKHGIDLGASTCKTYIIMAQTFVHQPPSGTQILRRSNGDTLFFNPADGRFAVMTRAGAPRTFFKIRDGAIYWRRQKQRETNRRTLRIDTLGSDD